MPLTRPSRHSKSYLFAGMSMRYSISSDVPAPACSPCSFISICLSVVCNRYYVKRALEQIHRRIDIFLKYNSSKLVTSQVALALALFWMLLRWTVNTGRADIDTSCDYATKGHCRMLSGFCFCCSIIHFHRLWLNNPRIRSMDLLNGGDLQLHPIPAQIQSKVLGILHRL